MADSPTLSDLQDAVYRQLRKYTYWFNQRDEGDGATTDFPLMQGEDSSTLTVTVNGVSADGETIDTAATTADGSHTIRYITNVDDDNLIVMVQKQLTATVDGAITYAPVDAGVAIFVRYNIQFWTDDDVTDALNAAIREFGSFFSMEVFSAPITPVLNQYEYQMPDDVWYPRRLQLINPPYGPKDIRTGWEPYDDGDTHWIRLYHMQWQPGATLRLIYFPEPAELSSDTDTLSDANMKARGQDCFVYEACFKLLHNVLPMRASSTAFGQTDDAAQIRVLDVMRATTEFHQMALEAAQRAMASPRVSRL